MILYFSGTGNSAYAAQRIGAAIGDTVVDLFEKIKGSDYSQLHSDSPWVIVTPTYAWRIPRIVQNWLEHTHLAGSRDIYFVMTCGDSFGNAGKYLQTLCKVKDRITWGVWKSSCRRITLLCILHRSRQRLWASSGKQTA